MDALHLYPSALSRDAALEALPDAAWTNRHLTFAEFIAELDRLLPLGKAGARSEVRGAGRLALLMRAARGGGLERIAGSERAVQAAAGLLATWKSANLRPHDVRATAAELATQPGARRAARTLERLALLYELYERELGKAWTDREGIERELLLRLEACERIPARLLPLGARVELHAFHRLVYVQFRIIERLLRLKHEVVVDSRISSVPANRKLLFGDLKLGLKTDDQPPKGRTANKLQRMEAPSPYAEVYEIGRRVRRWISEDRIAPREIGVTFRDLGQYSQALHDVFKRLGIPFFERRGEPAQFQPLVRVALSAIETCVNGLDRRSVFRFLCAGPVDAAAVAGTKGVLDAGALRELALKAGIERAYGEADPAEYWRGRLERFSRSPEEVAQKKGSFREENLAKALNAIVRKLSAMRVERPARKHAQAWRELFDQCGLSVARIAGELSAAAGIVSGGDAAALFKQRLALAALEAALDDVSRIPQAETEKITLESFAQLLTLAIQEQSVRADGTDRAGVRVLNFYDVRGLRFKRLVIGGMAEGLCPARPGPDPLLGQGAERALREALGKRVNDLDAQLFLAPRLSHETEAEERALFESALAVAKGGLLLTRPRADFDGRALGASEYWEHFSGSVESAMPIHPAPRLDECLTAEEAELRAAWVLGGGGNAGTAAADERVMALRAYESAPRLKALARRAAVERARYDYFLSQAQAAARSERDGEVYAPKQAGAYDGVVARPAASDAAAVFSEIAAGVTKRLVSWGGGGPAISPSGLERLAQCPFYFFARHVCGFDETSEPGEEISPLDNGELWHAVLARFYKEQIDSAAAQGRLTARLDPRRREEYLNRLQFFAGEEIETTVSKKFTGRAGFWQVQEKRLRALLGPWLDCELRTSDDGFFAAQVEFPFGEKEGAEGQALTLPLQMKEGAQAVEEAVRIRGRIDRIDFKTEMRRGVETVVAVRVIDYKLGRRDSYKDKTKEENLKRMLAPQVPLYLAAAISHVLAEKAAGKLDADIDSIWRHSCAGYYALRDTPLQSDGDKAYFAEISEWPLDNLRAFLDAATPNSLFDLARQRLAEIMSGNFAVQPVECAGVRCPARYTCRFQAVSAMGEDE